MTDKPLSEQIEQADASEFVRFAKLIAEQVMPEPCRLQKKHNWDKYIDNFSYPFEHCLARKESHIAAAIMLVDATGHEYIINKKIYYGKLIFQCDIKLPNSIEYGEHTTQAMALLAAIAKKVESE